MFIVIVNLDTLKLVQFAKYVIQLGIKIIFKILTLKKVHKLIIIVAVKKMTHQNVRFVILMYIEPKLSMD